MKLTKLTDLFRKALTAAELQTLFDEEAGRLRDLQQQLTEAQGARTEALVQEQLGNGNAAAAKVAVTTLQEQAEEAEARVEAVRRKLSDAERREAGEERDRLAAEAVQIEADYADWKRQQYEKRIEVAKSDRLLNPMRERKAAVERASQRLQDSYPDLAPVVVKVAVDALQREDYSAIVVAAGGESWM